MTLAPALHKTLLAGTARAPLTNEGVDAALRDVLAGAADLWRALAAEDLWQRAGFVPLQATAVQPAGDSGVPCPAAAEQVLLMILRGIHAEQLQPWLALARLHGAALPHSALAALLERGAQQPALRSSIAPLLGQRGNWLARQNPAWQPAYGAGDATAAHWELGTPAQRCAALMAMRQDDPAAALAALEADWPAAPPEQRAALLPCLEHGLSLHDEAFLERVLDDKRKEVRVAAQRLLILLPEAQLEQRCVTRLAALLTFAAPASADGAGAPALIVALPPVCDAAMKRDGIGIQAHRGLGEKAGWLHDLMAAVPPRHWSANWQMAPREIVALLARQEFNVALLGGLAQAAARALAVAPTAADIDWFTVLIKDDAPPNTGLDLAGMLLPDLWRLPAPAQDAVIARWLNCPPADARAAHYALDWAEQRFADGAAALSPALSHQLLANARRQTQLLPMPDYYAPRMFKVLGRVLDPALLETAQQHWPAAERHHWPDWCRLIDELMETLQFRRTMHASFLETEA